MDFGQESITTLIMVITLRISGVIQYYKVKDLQSFVIQ